LEEPGHFIVGKGQTNNSFSINDPYYNRTDLTQGYNNSFLSLGRYIPSNTDLSYLMFTISPDFDITVTNSANQQAGGSVDNPLNQIADADYYLQNGITDPLTQETSEGIKILTIPTPSDGTYNLAVTTTNPKPQNFSLQVYSYNTDGEVLTRELKGTAKQGSTATFSIPYNHEAASTKGHLFCDPSELKGDNSTLHKVLCQVLQFFSQE